MYAIWLLCLSHLRKKKMQNGLIFILIMLSTLLLATSITVIVNTENSFEEMHMKTNGSHQLLSIEKGLHDPQIVHSWWGDQEEVSATELLRYRNLSKVMYKNEEIPNLYLYMMDTPTVPMAVDELIFAQGEEQANPLVGSIWIPTSMANSNGISVGDSIQFNTGKIVFELQVSAIVVDIPYVAPFSNSARIWMNSQDYEEYISTMQGEDLYMIGLRYDDYRQNMKIWNDFEEFLGTPYLETKRDFGEISSFYLIINKMIGFIMIFLGAVMMAVALYTVGFTISDAILESYKTIGVLKSLGFSSFRLISTYIIQYAFLAAVSIIPGLLCGRFISQLIVESSLSNLKTDKTEVIINGINSSVAVGISVLAIVIFSVLFYANKARFIEPVQAIKFGMSEIDHTKMTKRLRFKEKDTSEFKSRSIYSMIGLRNIAKNRKGTLLMFALTAISSGVLVFGFNIITSVVFINQTAPLWGYDASHIAVTIFNKDTFSQEEFENDVLNDDRVKNIGWFGGKNGVIPSTGKTKSENHMKESMNISLEVIEGNFDELGFATIRGHNPTNKNEIIVGVNVARAAQKEIGDIVEIYIDGHLHSFTITGIYQAISNKSYSARVPADALKETSTNNEMEICYINLHDVQQADLIVDELNEKYKTSVTAYTQQTLLDTVFKEAVAVLIAPMSMMGLLFLLVTGIIIYSTCRMNIRKENKTYGIYKSIGMPSFKIRCSITGGIIILSSLGAVVGIFVGVYVLPLTLERVLSEYGIVQLPLILNWQGIILLAVASIVSAALGSWVSSKVINKTSPRILVSE
ncbi:FtsX-like permease family protein [Bacillus sp. Bva_UNVM-123]|uniref:ABC transporter permease n=1 Tax=Bacillus sp. Bva_UNVM-123 TaxID=2829798 RepID=UPI00391EFFC6